ncbi:MAG TPA: hypothetical protein PKC22_14145, partial [Rhodocyclaceae bacterium]|nr:hypothetical protein [Rhodocyclaceae bacterium]
MKRYFIVSAAKISDETMHATREAASVARPAWARVINPSSFCNRLRQNFQPQPALRIRANA